MRQLIKLSKWAAGLAVAGAGAIALADNTADIAISATVVGACDFNGNGLGDDNVIASLGNYDPLVGITDATGAGLSATCTNGSAIEIAASNGNNDAVNGATPVNAPSRRLTNGTDFLAYTLRVNGGSPTSDVNWGSLLPGTGTHNYVSAGVSVVLDYRITVAPYQWSAPAGAYSDTVVLTAVATP